MGEYEKNEPMKAKSTPAPYPGQPPMDQSAQRISIMHVGTTDP
jgi:hypothetical protein